MPVHILSRPASVILLTPLLFTACSPVITPTTGGLELSIRGAVHGGQQPVAGAGIMLYAAGTAGYGTAATPAVTPIARHP